MKTSELLREAKTRELLREAKTSELLHEAKGRLAKNYAEAEMYTKFTEFVCHAICEPGDCDPHPKANAVVKRIRASLDGCVTVSDWLQQEAKVKLPNGARAFDDALQAYRHRWLDALIAEYEAKGD